MHFFITTPPFDIRVSALCSLRHLIYDEMANTALHHTYISKALTDILNVQLKDPVGHHDALSNYLPLLLCLFTRLH